MKNDFKRCAFGAAIAFTGFLSAATASAEEGAVAEAKRYFDAGAQAFGVGQFGAAAEAFDRSFALAPRAGTLFSLGQAERRQYVVDHDPRRLKHAVDAYRRYLDSVEQGGRRAEAVEALSELEPLMDKLGTAAAPAGVTPSSSKVIVTSREGATVTLDGGASQGVPLIREVTAGKHRVVVSCPGCVTEVREIAVEVGGLTAVDIRVADMPGYLRLSGASGAEVWIDGRIRAEPSSTPFQVESGEHDVVVVKNGYRLFATHVRVAKGGTLLVPVSLVPSPQRSASTVLLVAGGVAMGAAIGLGAVAFVRESEAQSFLDRRAEGGLARNDVEGYSSDVSARDSFRTAAGASAFGGILLLATGVGLRLFDRPASSSFKPEPSADPRAGVSSLAPWYASGSVGVQAIGRF
jgi:hypothetical protein